MQAQGVGEALLPLGRTHDVDVLDLVLLFNVTVIITDDGDIFEAFILQHGTSGFSQLVQDIVHGGVDVVGAHPTYLTRVLVGQVPAGVILVDVACQITVW